MKFVTPAAEFDIPAYRHAIDVVITAMEILVDNSGYPTENIARNSHDYRPLGLGYANLGALLMYHGPALRLRPRAATSPPPHRHHVRRGIRAVSRRIAAASLGPFAGIRAESRAVPRCHPHAPRCGRARSTRRHVPFRSSTTSRRKECWDETVDLGEEHGYRNSQTTVLAPTGTIGFMMDCDTTGIEPDLALVKYKKLVGGGMIKIVNNTVPRALRLGYQTDEVNAIVNYIDATGTIEGAPGIRDGASARLRLRLQSAEGPAPSTTWATSR